MEIVDTSLADLAGFLARENLRGETGWAPSRIGGPVVATLGGDRIVGAARLHRYWLHPERWRPAVYVEPGSRRQGVGSALLAALVERLPATDRRELQASAGASNHAAVVFLDRQGFEPLMTTRLGILAPMTVPARFRGASREARIGLESCGFRIASLASMPERFDDVAVAHERVYRDGHAWDPPASLTREQRVDLFMHADELDPEMQLVALRDDAVCAVASLRITDDPDVLDLGWTGTLGMPPGDSGLLHRALIGTCVDGARRRGVSMTIELDRVDPHANAIVDELPVAWHDEWLTSRLARPAV